MASVCWRRLLDQDSEFGGLASPINRPHASGPLTSPLGCPSPSRALLGSSLVLDQLQPRPNASPSPVFPLTVAHSESIEVQVVSTISEDFSIRQDGRISGRELSPSELSKGPSSPCPTGASLSVVGVAVDLA
ncbi:hypothetical protein Salat_1425200 [Sesamum alatum]|uniref:Uncharacterized protein n=1 Tax=Sesamum alatum TaxID=300844 RepID=A0AAE1YAA0_9LAMI|nr:hypothetical protein Salat_1425200 [Sesamum alatum]